MRYKEITIDWERVVSRKLLPMPDGIITHNTTWQPCDTTDSHTLNDGQELAGVTCYISERLQGNGSRAGARLTKPTALDLFCGAGGDAPK